MTRYDLGKSTAMVSRLPFIIAFAVASGTSAADLTGRWAGTATNTDGTTVPIYLTVSEQDGVVSGHVIRGESNGVPLREAVISGDDLAFAVRDNLEPPARFALKFVVFGHPLGDRQVALKGTATTSSQQSTVDLYPLSVETLGKNGIDLSPVVVHTVGPVYTERARRANVRGTVLLRVEIEETGLISNEQIRVLRSLGYGLDEAAVKCVRQWRFKPAFRKGYAVRSAASIEVAFRL